MVPGIDTEFSKVIRDYPPNTMCCFLVKSFPSLFCSFWKPEQPKAKPQVVTLRGILLACYCSLGVSVIPRSQQRPQGPLVVGEDAVGLVHQTTANMEIKVRSLACLDLDTDFDARKI